MFYRKLKEYVHSTFFQTLDPFFENVQYEVSSQNNILKYKNLKLKKNLLKQYGFHISEGYIEELQIKIPYLYKMDCIEINVSNLIILIVPLNLEKINIFQIYEEAINDRKKILESIYEEFRQININNNINNKQFTNFLVNNIQSWVLTKLKIRINNIHLRYEDDNVDNMYSFGIIIPSVVYNNEESDESIPQKNNHGKLNVNNNKVDNINKNKMLQFSLGIYYNDKCKLFLKNQSNKNPLLLCIKEICYLYGIAYEEVEETLINKYVFNLNEKETSIKRHKIDSKKLEKLVFNTSEKKKVKKFKKYNNTKMEFDFKFILKPQIFKIMVLNNSDIFNNKTEIKFDVPNLYFNVNSNFLFNIVNIYKHIKMSFSYKQNIVYNHALMKEEKRKLKGEHTKERNKNFLTLNNIKDNFKSSYINSKRYYNIIHGIQHKVEKTHDLRKSFLKTIGRKNEIRNYDYLKKDGIKSNYFLEKATSNNPYLNKEFFNKKHFKNNASNYSYLIKNPNESDICFLKKNCYSKHKNWSHLTIDNGKLIKMDVPHTNSRNNEYEEPFHNLKNSIYRSNNYTGKNANNNKEKSNEEINKNNFKWFHVQKDKLKAKITDFLKNKIIKDYINIFKRKEETNSNNITSSSSDSLNISTFSSVNFNTNEQKNSDGREYSLSTKLQKEVFQKKNNISDHIKYQKYPKNKINVVSEFNLYNSFKSLFYENEEINNSNKKKKKKKKKYRDLWICAYRSVRKIIDLKNIKKNLFKKNVLSLIKKYNDFTYYYKIFIFYKYIKYNIPKKINKKINEIQVDLTIPNELLAIWKTNLLLNVYSFDKNFQRKDFFFIYSLFIKNVRNVRNKLSNKNKYIDKIKDAFSGYKENIFNLYRNEVNNEYDHKQHEFEENNIHIEKSYMNLSTKCEKNIEYFSIRINIEKIEIFFHLKYSSEDPIIYYNNNHLVLSKNFFYENYQAHKNIHNLEKNYNITKHVSCCNKENLQKNRLKEKKNIYKNLMNSEGSLEKKSFSCDDFHPKKGEHKSFSLNSSYEFSKRKCANKPINVDLENKCSENLNKKQISSKSGRRRRGKKKTKKKKKRKDKNMNKDKNFNYNKPLYTNMNNNLIISLYGIHIDIEKNIKDEENFTFSSIVRNIYIGEYFKCMYKNFYLSPILYYKILKEKNKNCLKKSRKSSNNSFKCNLVFVKNKYSDIKYLASNHYNVISRNTASSTIEDIKNLENKSVSKKVKSDSHYSGKVINYRNINHQSSSILSDRYLIKRNFKLTKNQKCVDENNNSDSTEEADSSLFRNKDLFFKKYGYGYNTVKETFHDSKNYLSAPYNEDLSHDKIEDNYLKDRNSFSVRMKNIQKNFKKNDNLNSFSKSMNFSNYIESDKDYTNNYTKELENKYQTNDNKKKRDNYKNINENNISINKNVEHPIKHKYYDTNSELLALKQKREKKKKKTFYDTNQFKNMNEITNYFFSFQIKNRTIIIDINFPTITMCSENYIMLNNFIELYEHNSKLYFNNKVMYEEDVFTTFEINYELYKSSCKLLQNINSHINLCSNFEKKEKENSDYFYYSELSSNEDNKKIFNLVKNNNRKSSFILNQHESNNNFNKIDEDLKKTYKYPFYRDCGYKLLKDKKKNIKINIYNLKIIILSFPYQNMYNKIQEYIYIHNLTKEEKHSYLINSTINSKKLSLNSPSLIFYINMISVNCSFDEDNKYIKIDLVKILAILFKKYKNFINVYNLYLQKNYIDLHQKMHRLNRNKINSYDSFVNKKKISNIEIFNGGTSPSNKEINEKKKEKINNYISNNNSRKSSDSFSKNEKLLKKSFTVDINKNKSSLFYEHKNYSNNCNNKSNFFYKNRYGNIYDESIKDNYFLKKKEFSSEVTYNHSLDMEVENEKKRNLHNKANKYNIYNEQSIILNNSNYDVCSSHTCSRFYDLKNNARKVKRRNKKFSNFTKLKNGNENKEKSSCSFKYLKDKKLKSYLNYSYEKNMNYFFFLFQKKSFKNILFYINIQINYNNYAGHNNRGDLIEKVIEVHLKNGKNAFINCSIQNIKKLFYIYNKMNYFITLYQIFKKYIYVTNYDLNSFYINNKFICFDYLNIFGIRKLNIIGKDNINKKFLNKEKEGNTYNRNQDKLESANKMKNENNFESKDKMKSNDNNTYIDSNECESKNEYEKKNKKKKLKLITNKSLIMSSKNWPHIFLRNYYYLKIHNTYTKSNINLEDKKKYIYKRKCFLYNSLSSKASNKEYFFLYKKKKTSLDHLLKKKVGHTSNFVCSIDQKEKNTSENYVNNFKTYNSKCTHTPNKYNYFKTKSTHNRKNGYSFCNSCNLDSFSNLNEERKKKLSSFSSRSLTNSAIPQYIFPCNSPILKEENNIYWKIRKSIKKEKEYNYGFINRQTNFKKNNNDVYLCVFMELRSNQKLKYNKHFIIKRKKKNKNNKKLIFLVPVLLYVYVDKKNVTPSFIFECKSVKFVCRNNKQLKKVKFKLNLNKKLNLFKYIRLRNKIMNLHKFSNSNKNNIKENQKNDTYKIFVSNDMKGAINNDEIKMGTYGNKEKMNKYTKSNNVSIRKLNNNDFLFYLLSSFEKFSNNNIFHNLNKMKKPLESIRRNTSSDRFYFNSMKHEENHIINSNKNYEEKNFSLLYKSSIEKKKDRESMKKKKIDPKKKIESWNNLPYINGKNKKYKKNPNKFYLSLKCNVLENFTISHFLFKREQDKVIKAKYKFLSSSNSSNKNNFIRRISNYKKQQSKKKVYFILYDEKKSKEKKNKTKTSSFGILEISKMYKNISIKLYVDKLNVIIDNSFNFTIYGCGIYFENSLFKNFLIRTLIRNLVLEEINNFSSYYTNYENMNYNIFKDNLDESIRYNNLSYTEKEECESLSTHYRKKKNWIRRKNRDIALNVKDENNCNNYYHSENLNDFLKSDINKNETIGNDYMHNTLIDNVNNYFVLNLMNEKLKNNYNYFNKNIKTQIIGYKEKIIQSQRKNVYGFPEHNLYTGVSIENDFLVDVTIVIEKYKRNKNININLSFYSYVLYVSPLILQKLTQITDRILQLIYKYDILNFYFNYINNINYEDPSESTSNMFNYVRNSNLGDSINNDISKKYHVSDSNLIEHKYFARMDKKNYFYHSNKGRSLSINNKKKFYIKEKEVHISKKKSAPSSINQKIDKNITFFLSHIKITFLQSFTNTFINKLELSHFTILFNNHSYLLKVGSIHFLNYTNKYIFFSKCDGVNKEQEIITKLKKKEKCNKNKIDNKVTQKRNDKLSYEVKDSNANTNLINEKDNDKNRYFIYAKYSYKSKLYAIINNIANKNNDHIDSIHELIVQINKSHIYLFFVDLLLLNQFINDCVIAILPLKQKINNKTFYHNYREKILKKYKDDIYFLKSKYIHKNYSKFKKKMFNLFTISYEKKGTYINSFEKSKNIKNYNYIVCENIFNTKNFIYKKNLLFDVMRTNSINKKRKSTTSNKKGKKNVPIIYLIDIKIKLPLIKFLSSNKKNKKTFYIHLGTIDVYSQINYIDKYKQNTKGIKNMCFHNFNILSALSLSNINNFIYENDHQRKDIKEENEKEQIFCIFYYLNIIYKKGRLFLKYKLKKKNKNVIIPLSNEFFISFYLFKRLSNYQKMKYRTYPSIFKKSLDQLNLYEENKVNKNFYYNFIMNFNKAYSNSKISKIKKDRDTTNLGEIYEEIENLFHKKHSINILVEIENLNIVFTSEILNIIKDNINSKNNSILNTNYLLPYESINEENSSFRNTKKQKKKKKKKNHYILSFNSLSNKEYTRNLLRYNNKKYFPHNNLKYFTYFYDYECTKYKKNVNNKIKVFKKRKLYFEKLFSSVNNNLFLYLKLNSIHLQLIDNNANKLIELVLFRLNVWKIKKLNIFCFCLNEFSINEYITKNIFSKNNKRAIDKDSKNQEDKQWKHKHIYSDKVQQKNVLDPCYLGILDEKKILNKLKKKKNYGNIKLLIKLKKKLRKILHSKTYMDSYIQEKNLKEYLNLDERRDDYIKEKEMYYNSINNMNKEKQNYLLSLCFSPRNNVHHSMNYIFKLKCKNKNNNAFSIFSANELFYNKLNTLCSEEQTNAENKYLNKENKNQIKNENQLNYIEKIRTLEIEKKKENNFFMNISNVNNNYHPSLETDYFLYWIHDKNRCLKNEQKEFSNPLLKKRSSFKLFLLTKRNTILRRKRKKNNEKTCFYKHLKKVDYLIYKNKKQKKKSCILLKHILYSTKKEKERKNEKEVEKIIQNNNKELIINNFKKENTFCNSINNNIMKNEHQKISNFNIYKNNRSNYKNIIRIRGMLKKRKDQIKKRKENGKNIGKSVLTKIRISESNICINTIVINYIFILLKYEYYYDSKSLFKKSTRNMFNMRGSSQNTNFVSAANEENIKKVKYSNSLLDNINDTPSLNRSQKNEFLKDFLISGNTNKKWRYDKLLMAVSDVSKNRIPENRLKRNFTLNMNLLNLKKRKFKSNLSMKKSNNFVYLSKYFKKELEDINTTKPSLYIQSDVSNINAFKRNSNDIFKKSVLNIFYKKWNSLSSNKTYLNNLKYMTENITGKNKNENKKKQEVIMQSYNRYENERLLFLNYNFLNIQYLYSKFKNILKKAKKRIKRNKKHNKKNFLYKDTSRNNQSNKKNFNDFTNIARNSNDDKHVPCDKSSNILKIYNTVLHKKDMWKKKRSLINKKYHIKYSSFLNGSSKEYKILKRSSTNIILEKKKKKEKEKKPIKYEDIYNKDNYKDKHTHEDMENEYYFFPSFSEHNYAFFKNYVYNNKSFIFSKYLYDIFFSKIKKKFIYMFESTNKIITNQIITHIYIKIPYSSNSFHVYLSAYFSNTKNCVHLFNYNKNILINMDKKNINKNKTNNRNNNIISCENRTNLRDGVYDIYIKHDIDKSLKQFYQKKNNKSKININNKFLFCFIKRKKKKSKKKMKENNSFDSTEKNKNSYFVYNESDCEIDFDHYINKNLFMNKEFSIRSNNTKKNGNAHYGSSIFSLYNNLIKKKDNKSSLHNKYFNYYLKFNEEKQKKNDEILFFPVLYKNKFLKRTKIKLIFEHNKLPYNKTYLEPFIVNSTFKVNITNLSIKYIKNFNQENDFICSKHYKNLIKLRTLCDRISPKNSFINYVNDAKNTKNINEINKLSELRINITYTINNKNINNILDYIKNRIRKLDENEKLNNLKKKKKTFYREKNNYSIFSKESKYNSKVNNYISFKEIEQEHTSKSYFLKLKEGLVIDNYDNKQNVVILKEVNSLKKSKETKKENKKFYDHILKFVLKKCYVHFDYNDFVDIFNIYNYIKPDGYIDKMLEKIKKKKKTKKKNKDKDKNEYKEKEKKTNEINEKVKNNDKYSFKNNCENMNLNILDNYKSIIKSNYYFNNIVKTNYNNNYIFINFLTRPSKYVYDLLINKHNMKLKSDSLNYSHLINHVFYDNNIYENAKSFKFKKNMNLSHIVEYEKKNNKTNIDYWETNNYRIRKIEIRIEEVKVFIENNYCMKCSNPFLFFLLKNIYINTYNKFDYSFIINNYNTMKKKKLFNKNEYKKKENVRNNKIKNEKKKSDHVILKKVCEKGSYNSNCSSKVYLDKCKSKKNLEKFQNFYNFIRKYYYMEYQENNNEQKKIEKSSNFKNITKKMLDNAKRIYFLGNFNFKLCIFDKLSNRWKDVVEDVEFFIKISNFKKMNNFKLFTHKIYINLTLRHYKYYQELLINIYYIIIKKIEENKLMKKKTTKIIVNKFLTLKKKMDESNKKSSEKLNIGKGITNQIKNDEIKNLKKVNEKEKELKSYNEPSLLINKGYTNYYDKKTYNTTDNKRKCEKEKKVYFSNMYPKIIDYFDLRKKKNHISYSCNNINNYYVLFYNCSGLKVQIQLRKRKKKKTSVNSEGMLIKKSSNIYINHSNKFRKITKRKKKKDSIKRNKHHIEKINQIININMLKKLKKKCKYFYKKNYKKNKVILPKDIFIGLSKSINNSKIYCKCILSIRIYKTEINVDEKWNLHLKDKEIFKLNNVDILRFPEIIPVFIHNKNNKKEHVMLIVKKIDKNNKISYIHFISPLNLYNFSSFPLNYKITFDKKIYRIIYSICNYIKQIKKEEIKKKIQNVFIINKKRKRNESYIYLKKKGIYSNKKKNIYHIEYMLNEHFSKTNYMYDINKNIQKYKKKYNKENYDKEIHFLKKLNHYEYIYNKFRDVDDDDDNNNNNNKSIENNGNYNKINPHMDTHNLNNSHFLRIRKLYKLIKNKINGINVKERQKDPNEKINSLINYIYFYISNSVIRREININILCLIKKKYSVNLLLEKDISTLNSKKMLLSGNGSLSLNSFILNNIYGIKFYFFYGKDRKNFNIENNNENFTRNKNECSQIKEFPQHKFKNSERKIKLSQQAEIFSKNKTMENTKIKTLFNENLNQTNNGSSLAINGNTKVKRKKKRNLFKIERELAQDEIFYKSLCIRKRVYVYVLCINKYYKLFNYNIKDNSMFLKKKKKKINKSQKLETNENENYTDNKSLNYVLNNYFLKNSLKKENNFINNNSIYNKKIKQKYVGTFIVKNIIIKNPVCIYNYLFNGLFLHIYNNLKKKEKEESKNKFIFIGSYGYHYYMNLKKFDKIYVDLYFSENTYIKNYLIWDNNQENSNNYNKNIYGATTNNNIINNHINKNNEINENNKKNNWNACEGIKENMNKYIPSCSEHKLKNGDFENKKKYTYNCFNNFSVSKNYSCNKLKNKIVDTCYNCLRCRRKTEKHIQTNFIRIFNKHNNNIIEIIVTVIINKDNNILDNNLIYSNISSFISIIIFTPIVIIHKLPYHFDLLSTYYFNDKKEKYCYENVCNTYYICNNIFKIRFYKKKDSNTGKQFSPNLNVEDNYEKNMLPCNLIKKKGWNTYDIINTKNINVNKFELFRKREKKEKTIYFENNILNSNQYINISSKDINVVLKKNKNNLGFLYNSDNIIYELNYYKIIKHKEYYDKNLIKNYVDTEEEEHYEEKKTEKLLFLYNCNNYIQNKIKNNPIFLKKKKKNNTNQDMINNNAKNIYRCEDDRITKFNVNCLFKIKSFFNYYNYDNNYNIPFIKMSNYCKKSFNEYEKYFSELKNNYFPSIFIYELLPQYIFINNTDLNLELKYYYIRKEKDTGADRGSSNDSIKDNQIKNNNFKKSAISEENNFDIYKHHTYNNNDNNKVKNLAYNNNDTSSNNVFNNITSDELTHNKSINKKYSNDKNNINKKKNNNKIINKMFTYDIFDLKKNSCSVIDFYNKKNIFFLIRLKINLYNFFLSFKKDGYNISNEKNYEKMKNAINKEANNTRNCKNNYMKENSIYRSSILCLKKSIKKETIKSYRNLNKEKNYSKKKNLYLNEENLYFHYMNVGDKNIKDFIKEEKNNLEKISNPFREKYTQQHHPYQHEVNDSYNKSENSNIKQDSFFSSYNIPWTYGILINHSDDELKDNYIQSHKKEELQKKSDSGENFTKEYYNNFKKINTKKKEYQENENISTNKKCNNKKLYSQKVYNLDKESEENENRIYKKKYSENKKSNYFKEKKNKYEFPSNSTSFNIDDMSSNYTLNNKRIKKKKKEKKKKKNNTFFNLILNNSESYRLISTEKSIFHKNSNKIKINNYSHIVPDAYRNDPNGNYHYDDNSSYITYKEKKKLKSNISRNSSPTNKVQCFDKVENLKTFFLSCNRSKKKKQNSNYVKKDCFEKATYSLKKEKIKSNEVDIFHRKCFNETILSYNVIPLINNFSNILYILEYFIYRDENYITYIYIQKNKQFPIYFQNLLNYSIFLVYNDVNEEEEKVEKEKEKEKRDKNRQLYLLSYDNIKYASKITSKKVFSTYQNEKYEKSLSSYKNFNNSKNQNMNRLFLKEPSIIYNNIIPNSYILAHKSTYPLFLNLFLKDCTYCKNKLMNKFHYKKGELEKTTNLSIHNNPIKLNNNSSINQNTNSEIINNNSIICKGLSLYDPLYINKITCILCYNDYKILKKKKKKKRDSFIFKK